MDFIEWLSVEKNKTLEEFYDLPDIDQIDIEDEFHNYSGV